MNSQFALIKSWALTEQNLNHCVIHKINSWMFDWKLGNSSDQWFISPIYSLNK